MFSAGNPIYCDYDECDVSEIISIKIFIGTCGHILDSKTGQSLYILENIPDTDYYYNGRLSSCPTHRQTIKCPSGTFVKHIEWDRISNLKEGINMRCNKPESISISEAIIISSHPNAHISEPEKRTCDVFDELTIARNISQDIDGDILLEKDCTVENRPATKKTIQCPPSTAIAGMDFSIETRSK